MAKDTKIQWCDTTVNPTMGCEGCELWAPGNKSCYAGLFHKRVGPNRKGFAKDFDTVEAFPGRLAMVAQLDDLAGEQRATKPWLNGLPRLIFVSDMSDALSESIPFEYLQKEIIDVVLTERGRRHRWLWLTKRPQRMAEFSRFIDQPWPSNLWVGTSVTTQASTARIKHLVQVGDQHTVRFVSVEPQWERITLNSHLAKLDWVIQGGQSGTVKYPFQLSWARSMRYECGQYGVAYFLKQLGTCVLDGKTRLLFEDSHAGDWNAWPQDLRVRQFPELPAAKRTAPERRRISLLATNAN